MTEPEAGSDAFAIQTTADRDGDDFVLAGTKRYISNIPIADLVIIYAVTDREKGFHGGTTAFIVPRDTPGLEFRGPFSKMGLRSSPLGEINMRGVRVPPDAVLGRVGGGGAIFPSAMDWERVLLMASHVGTMQRLLDGAIRHARKRKQFGQAIGKFQAVAHRLVDMKVQLEAARLLIYRAASRLDVSREVGLDASIAKLFASESYIEVAMGILRTLGAAGYVGNDAVERSLRDAVGSVIYSGTSDMQRNIIARWLGL